MSMGLHVTVTEYDVSRQSAYKELDNQSCKFMPGTIVVVHNAKSRKLPRAVRHMILCGRHMRVSSVLVNSVIVDKNLRANIDVTVGE
jgi:hypothetical protein